MKVKPTHYKILSHFHLSQPQTNINLESLTNKNFAAQKSQARTGNEIKTRGPIFFRHGSDAQTPIHGDWDVVCYTIRIIYITIGAV